MAKKLRTSAIQKTQNLLETTVDNIHLQLTRELYRSFDFFNSHFSNNELVRPIIIVASVDKVKAHGWLAIENWADGNGTPINEIRIAAESMHKGIDETLHTLLHEIAHLKNYQNKIEDCTVQQRHNKHFKDSAESFGLSVGQSTRFGFGHTRLDEKAMEAIQLLAPKEEVYTLYRNTVSSKDREKKEKKPATLKPAMVDQKTKDSIEAMAKKSGKSQKDVAAKAIAYYQYCINSGIEMPEEYRI